MAKRISDGMVSTLIDHCAPRSELVYVIIRGIASGRVVVDGPHGRLRTRGVDGPTEWIDWVSLTESPRIGRAAVATVTGDCVYVTPLEGSAEVE